MYSSGRVFIVDDHPIVREGLSALIASSGDLTVCGEAATTAEAIQLIAQLQPDVALIDLAMNGNSGLDLIKRIHKRYPQIRLLVVSMYEEAAYAAQARSAGAMGYVNKRQAAKEVIEAVRALLGDRSYFNEEILRAQAERVKLSSRELQVFELIAQGLSTAHIAADLHLSVKTVETHREHIKEKLGLDSSRALTVRAVQWFHEK